MTISKGCEIISTFVLWRMGLQWVCSGFAVGLQWFVVVFNDLSYLRTVLVHLTKHQTITLVKYTLGCYQLHARRDYDVADSLLIRPSTCAMLPLITARFSANPCFRFPNTSLLLFRSSVAP